MCKGGLFCENCEDYEGGDLIISGELILGEEPYYELISCSNTDEDGIPKKHAIYIVKRNFWDDIENEIAVLACGGCEYKVFECQSSTPEKVEFLTQSCGKFTKHEELHYKKCLTVVKIFQAVQSHWNVKIAENAIRETNFSLNIIIIWDKSKNKLILIFLVIFFKFNWIFNILGCTFPSYLLLSTSNIFFCRLHQNTSSITPPIYKTGI